MFSFTTKHHLTLLIEAAWSLSTDNLQQNQLTLLQQATIIQHMGLYSHI